MTDDRKWTDEDNARAFASFLKQVADMGAWWLVNEVVFVNDDGPTFTLTLSDGSVFDLPVATGPDGKVYEVIFTNDALRAEIERLRDTVKIARADTLKP